MSHQPWSPEKRARVKRQIDNEASRAANRLGALHVKLIAFFADGEHLHIQDGGEAPMPDIALYQGMATAAVVREESDGEDVAIQ